jgi:hypothetical protein
MAKLLWPWGATLFLIFYTVTAPSEAAAVVHSTFGLLSTVADGMSNFVSDIAA